ncbi:MAG: hypothetical protein ABIO81_13775 [Ginsengibacter sp.]
MPNHLHVLIDFGDMEKSIHIIVSNGKRFIAYEIVKRLQHQHEARILLQLKEEVTSLDKTGASGTRYLNDHLIAKK